MNNIDSFIEVRLQLFISLNSQHGDIVSLIMVAIYVIVGFLMFISISCKRWHLVKGKWSFLGFFSIMSVVIPCFCLVVLHPVL